MKNPAAVALGRDALKTIQGLLDGVEWTPETLEAIADVLRQNGYQVRDVTEAEEPEPEPERSSGDVCTVCGGVITHKEPHTVCDKCRERGG